MLRGFGILERLRAASDAEIESVEAVWPRARMAIPEVIEPNTQKEIDTVEIWNDR